MPIWIWLWTRWKKSWVWNQFWHKSLLKMVNLLIWSIWKYWRLTQKEMLKWTRLVLIKRWVYTCSPKYFWTWLFLALNHDNHKNGVPVILSHNLCLILMGMKQTLKYISGICWIQKMSFFQIHQFSIFLTKISGIP